MSQCVLKLTTSLHASPTLTVLTWLQQAEVRSG